MGTYKQCLALILLSLVTMQSCDQSLDPPNFDERTESEKQLLHDWQYQFAIMDGDTIRHFDWDGEPSIDQELETDARLRMLRYNEDKSYEFIADNRGIAYGYWENYQPGFGNWKLLELEPDSLILIHNEIMNYEKKYNLEIRNDTIMIKRLIGSRITYLIYELNPLDYDVLVVSNWVEVLYRKD